MQRICYSICAVLCTAAVILHEVAGTPVILGPLGSADVDPSVVGMLAFTWHNDTVYMLGVAFLFGWAARRPADRMAGLLATAVLVGIGISAFSMAIFYHPVMWSTPAPYLWSMIPLIAVVGALSKVREG